MRPSEAPPAVEVAARPFHYDVGAFGPAAPQAVAVETPVEFVIGGAPFAVMMATPTDLVDFAYGFLMTEGVAAGPHDIRGVTVEPAGEAFRLVVALTAERLQAHLARARALAGRSGCGLCGVADLDHLPAPGPVAPSPPIDPAAIGKAIRRLDARQGLNRLTRAVHAAAWCDRDGRIAFVREDVGRHNALDKTIGALMRAGVAPASGFLLVTSRCSFEIVAKAASFGAGTLVTLSAPTSLALERARRLGVTVIAVARADRALSFADADAKASGEVAA